MSEDSRSVEFEFSKNSMTLGEALEKPKSGFRLGSAERFIDIQAPLYDKQENEFVRNRVYAFACHFEGHEENNLNEDGDYVDPLDTPLQDALDFFSAGKKIWDQTEEQLSELSILNPVKKGRLTSLQTSVGEDMERVAEAIVLSVADKVAETDAKLAKMVGKLEGSLDQERDAEEGNENAVTTYALSASNPSASTPAIIGMAGASDIEERAERKRVKLTKDIVDAVAPQLTELNLLDHVNEWISFSN